MYEMFECIKTHETKAIKALSAANAIYLLPVLQQQQFPYKRCLFILLYRCSWIFGKLNDKLRADETNDPYVISARELSLQYHEIAMMGFVVHYAMFIGITPRELIYSMPKRFLRFVKHFLCDRKEFISFQTKLTPKVEDSIFGVSALYQYPFVEDNDSIFLPVPQLLNRAITASLLYRVAEYSSSISQILGNIIENYVYTILNESGIFDFVDPEIRYGKTEKRSADATGFVDGNIVLFECKKKAPKSAIRILDMTAIDEDVNITACAVKQVFNQAKDLVKKRYSLSNPISEVSLNNIYCVVILREDNYLPMQVILNRVHELMDVPLCEEDDEFLSSHIRIFDLYQLETLVFAKSDIIVELKNNEEESGKLTDRLNKIYSMSAMPRIIEYATMLETEVYSDFELRAFMETHKIADRMKDKLRI